MASRRMTANPTRPARHRAGKVMPESESSSESSAGEEEEKEEVPQEKVERRVRAPPRIVSAPRAPKDEKTLREERAEMERMAAEAGFVTESEGAASSEEGEGGAESGDEEGSSSEEEESDEESDEESEEEEKPRLMLRPKFIPKAQRGQSARDKAAEEEEAEVARKAEEANALVEEQIKRDIAARAAGKKHWEDTDEEPEDEVDDTDGLDPEAELAAFRLRKLKRYKRDREVMLAREREIEELERRRNLTEEERRAEDEDKIRKQEEEQEGRGKMGYMRKYFHGGAFYQEEAEEAGLADRDLAGARFEDEVSKDRLPEYLQRRDMTKIGRKGATRYRDLRSEDTGSWGDFDRREGRRWEGDDERFRPDARGPGADHGGQGANAIPLGRTVPGAPGGPRGSVDKERGEGEDRHGAASKDRETEDRGKTGPRDRSAGDGRPDRDGKEYRERERDRERDRRGHRDRERSRDGERSRDKERSRHGSRDRYRARRSPSRSRSPRERHRRKRSTSPGDRYDKRRRVDAR